MQDVAGDVCDALSAELSAGGAKNIERILLVGHSLGGVLALTLLDEQHEEHYHCSEAA